MRAVAPPGLAAPGEAALGELRRLTAELAAAMPEAIGEAERYLRIRDRRIQGADARVGGWVAGQTVLVTGGTGCIGSALIADLAAHRAGRVVSVSRGVSADWPRHADAEYRQADVRDRAAVDAVFSDVRPDVVFHLAGQRDPGLAEAEVHRTVTTNVLGTWNIAAAAHESAALLVCASTGKALRPYTADVYSSSKRAAEWVLAWITEQGGRAAAVRFTHVVDNSIVAGRLRRWCADGLIRLHSSDAMFYAQSAAESAQLLLAAGRTAAEARAPHAAVAGGVTVHALTDLGWPVSLVELAVGTILATGSRAAIYISGPDAGYEGPAFPGLYDPRTAGEVSPLLNAFEAARSRPLPGLGIDVFPLEFASAGGVRDELENLSAVCGATAESAAVRSALGDLSLSVLHATLAAVPGVLLERMAALAAPHRAALSAEQGRLLAEIEQHAGVGLPLADRGADGGRTAPRADQLLPAQP